MDSYKKIYVIMRERGIRSDGYYYESDTSIIGLRDTPEEAAKLLKNIALKFHKNEKPCMGTYNEYGDTRIEYQISADLSDIFWIEEEYLNQEIL